jgi:hypothetical protein
MCSFSFFEADLKIKYFDLMNDIKKNYFTEFYGVASSFEINEFVN